MAYVAELVNGGGGRSAAKALAAAWACTVLLAGCASGGASGTADPCGTPDAPDADGSPCGTDLVCSAGACVLCVEGEACAPANPCRQASVSCASGPSCVDGAPVADRTACETSRVCISGACVTGLPGSPCTPAIPCHQGTLADDGVTCVDGGTAQPDGVVCGTDQVCTAGICVRCVEGEICMTGATCQYQSRMSCSTGASCVVGDFFPNGSYCAPGRVCRDGQCVQ